jgi:hypothetical protein
MSRLLILATLIIFARSGVAGQVDLSCKIRSNAVNLDCQFLGKERAVMHPDDIPKVIDSADDGIYITAKSRKNLERIFYVDAKSAQFKHLNDLRGSAPISEISSAKVAVFGEIEKRIIKLMDELDGQSESADLVLFDSSITYEKFKRENRAMVSELESYRGNKEKVCTSTPAFETISNANLRLQRTLSGILTAFQTPGTCMSEFKISRDRDGAVDLRQVDTVSDFFKSRCVNRGTASTGN